MALTFACAAAASSALTVPVGGTLSHRFILRGATGGLSTFAPVDARSLGASTPPPLTSAEKPPQLRPRLLLPEPTLAMKSEDERVRPMRTSCLTRRGVPEPSLSQAGPEADKAISADLSQGNLVNEFESCTSKCLALRIGEGVERRMLRNSPNIPAGCCCTALASGLGMRRSRSPQTGNTGASNPSGASRNGESTRRFEADPGEAQVELKSEEGRGGFPFGGDFGCSPNDP